MKRTKDIPTDFWNKWLGSESEQRIKMVEKTMLARELAELMMQRCSKTKIKKSYTKSFAARMVNDYFEDLETVLRLKNGTRVTMGSKMSALKKMDALTANSKLTENDTVIVGRKVNKAVAKRLKGKVTKADTKMTDEEIDDLLMRR